MVLGVYIPTEGSDLRDEIWPGSGIVGSEVGDTGRLRIDFEGDDDLYPKFRDRVKRAAERHTWEGPDGTKGYPTSACAFVDPSEVQEIGRYDPEDDDLHFTWMGKAISWAGESLERDS